MARLTPLGFKAGDTVLHRLDPRTKQLMLLGLSAACLVGAASFLMVMTATLAWAIGRLPLGAAMIFNEIRYFLYFLAVVWIVRAIGFEDRFIPTTSPVQLIDATLFCWRLLLVVLMGVLLVATTRVDAIRAALIWFLAPLPLVNAPMTGTMVGLVVRFIPLILVEAGDIDAAMRARGIETRKNPLVRPVRFTATLLRTVFARAGGLADAMQARCYSENRTRPELRFGGDDARAGAACLVLLLLALATAVG